jgi:hypothetical protein
MARCGATATGGTSDDVGRTGVPSKCSDGNIFKQSNVVRAEALWGDAIAMPSSRDEVARWLALAAEARAVAAEMTEPAARAIMFKIAEGYENLARRAEGRQKNSS